MRKCFSNIALCLLFVFNFLVFMLGTPLEFWLNRNVIIIDAKTGSILGSYLEHMDMPIMATWFDNYLSNNLKFFILFALFFTFYILMFYLNNKLIEIKKSIIYQNSKLITKILLLQTTILISCLFCLVLCLFNYSIFISLSFPFVSILLSLYEIHYFNKYFIFVDFKKVNNIQCC